MSWKEMARYRAGSPDGGTEEFVLEKDDEGNFRIRNDFGNTVSREVTKELVTKKVLKKTNNELI